MEFVYLGKIVNTHGIKGEIRILSDFDYKELVFKKDFDLYIGKDKIKEKINSYRIHKNYDMVTLLGYNDINEVLKYKGLNVYINKEDINGVLVDEDFIGLDAFTTHYIGEVTEVMKGQVQDILVIENNTKRYLVPKIDEFIKNIDFDENKIYINNIKGLIDED